MKAPKAGGDATPVVKVPGSKVQQLAADETAVYWADLGSGDPAWTGRVKKASLADGKVETISDAPSPLAVTVDADTVFWASGGVAGGRILAQRKAGGPTFVLARDLHGPQSLVVDGKYAYWVDAGDGNVCRTEKTPHASP